MAAADQINVNDFRLLCEEVMGLKMKAQTFNLVPDCVVLGSDWLRILRETFALLPGRKGSDMSSALPVTTWMGLPVLPHHEPRHIGIAFS